MSGLLLSMEIIKNKPIFAFLNILVFFFRYLFVCDDIFYGYLRSSKDCIKSETNNLACRHLIGLSYPVEIVVKRQKKKKLRTLFSKTNTSPRYVQNPKQCEPYTFFSCINNAKKVIFRMTIGK